MVQRGGSFRGRESSRRLLFFIWGLVSILICGIYSAFLVSQRVAATVALPFTNLLYTLPKMLCCLLLLLPQIQWKMPTVGQGGWRRPWKRASTGSSSTSTPPTSSTRYGPIPIRTPGD